MSRVLLQSKYPGESRFYTFDFTSQLGAGVTVASGAVSAAVFSGIDASPSSLISGAATVVNASFGVQQKITAGVAGVIYDLTCTATLSDATVQILQAFLTVLPAQP